MRRVYGFLWALFGCVASAWSAGEPHRFAANTVVLANADDPTSIAIARTYQDARGIPEKNVVLLSVSDKVTISRAAFIESIWNPLRKALLDRSLLEGESTAEADVLGRVQFELRASKVRYLVVCRGVPVKIAEVEGLDDSSLFPDQGRSAGGERFPPQLQKNHASVDSELALLIHERIPVTGVVPNPVFRKLPLPADAQIVRVTRLDGPTPEGVLGMIRDTLRAEKIGLRGRAYFDMAARSGTYQIGDQWIARAAELASTADFDVTIDEGGKEFAIDSRFDAPAIYFGWYASGLTGVFRLPELSFPPGAIVAHLHSASASDLRHPNKGWVGPLLASGVTATVGNVYEPYLEQTHHFDVLLEGLLQGMNFGDAAYAAVPTLSWQTVAVGDPLYEPFWVGLEEQSFAVGDPSNAASDPYVVIRKMNQLRREGKTDEAQILGIRALYETPGAALALKVAEWEARHGAPERATRRLEFAALIDVFEPQEWALFHTIARRLAEWGGIEAGVRVYTNLLADDRLPKSLRMSLLAEGADLARRSGKTGEAVAWRQEWHILNGPAAN